MQYVGGKARVSGRQVIAAILADTDARAVWWEPFVGGGNVMEKAAPHFAQSFGTDLHPDLILLWQHVTAGGEVPDTITRDEYAALRRADPSWLRGLAGFGASFSGKWFGGYADTRVGASCRAVRRQGAVFAASGTRFAQGSYDTFVPTPGCVVYCDPPYSGTTGYSTGAFDHAHYYRTLQWWARLGAHVYGTEYVLPPVPHELLAVIHKRRTLGVSRGPQSVAVEYLVRIEP
jgi:DNA adenine methylase